MTWKNKTCERCAFRVGDECRRFPPSYAFNPMLTSWYNQVVKDRFVYGGKEVDISKGLPPPIGAKVEGKIYAPACAEYAELIEPPKTKEAT